MREIVRWHERSVGRAKVRAIAASLPPELVGFLELDSEALGIMPSAWYPSELGHDLVARIFEDHDEAARSAAMRDACHAALRASARGVYRMVLERLGTPRVMAGSIQRLWNILHDDGERSVALLGELEMESRTRAWSGHGPSPVLCEMMSETTAAILETMGKRNVRVDRLACVAKGAPECVVRYRWTDRFSVFPPAM